MARDFVYDIVDANARIIHEDEKTERIDFLEVIPYINQKLDRDKVEAYHKRRKKASNATINSTSTLSDSEIEAPIQKMEEEYFNHINSFDVEIDIYLDQTGDGRVDKKRTLKGDPRTDIDMRTGIEPSILPLQFEDSEEYLVFRELKPYDREFVREYIAQECEFTGHRGSSYDWNFHDNLEAGEHQPGDKPNNFSYVPEPLDFLALNGIDGFHERIEEDDEIPYISVPDWSILNVGERDQKIVGLRPFYDNIWEAGVTETEAEKVGRWRGANRAIGRTLHDMDDEFFHGFNGDKHFVGFYDNEFPFITGSEMVFNSDEWKRFKRNFRKEAEASEAWTNKLISIIRENELETAQKTQQREIEYSELIDREVSEDLIPRELRANKIF